MLPNTKKTIFTQCFFYPELLEPFQEFLLVAINKKKKNFKNNSYYNYPTISFFFFVPNE